MDEENPWQVGQIEDFLYFCCPECEEKCHEKDQFLKHAIEDHPKARSILPNLIENCKENEIKIDQEIIKEEPSTTIFNDFDDDPIQDDDFIKDEIQQPEIQEGQVQCYYCSNLFDETEIEDHQRDEHKRVSEEMYGFPRPFKCSKCHYALAKDPIVHNVHVCKPEKKVRRKKGEKKEILKCKECGKTYTSQACLFNHMATIHTDVRKCKICDKQFMAKCELKKHMATAHSDERNFPCPHCDFKAKLKNVLNVHIKAKCCVDVVFHLLVLIFGLFNSYSTESNSRQIEKAVSKRIKVKILLFQEHAVDIPVSGS